MAPLDHVSTGKGDDGTTGLPGGKRLAKDDSLLELLGDLDELQSALGVARVEAYGTLKRRLWRLLNLVSRAAALVADVPQRRIEPGACPPVSEMEREQAEMVAGLRAPQTFVVPGANRLEAALHVARTVCRRSERHLVSAARHRPDAGLEGLFPFMNRTSDYLFVLALSADPERGSTDTA